MGKYDDIIHLPHPTSATRPRMSAENRAAQFSPFAALTGYDAAVKETARTTDRRIELDENAIAALDEKLRLLGDRIAERPDVAITYFQSDEKKAGGAYVTVTSAIKKIDNIEGVLVLVDGMRIAIRDVLEIEGEVFGIWCEAALS